MIFASPTILKPVPARVGHYRLSDKRLAQRRFFPPGSDFYVLQREVVEPTIIFVHPADLPSDARERFQHAGANFFSDLTKYCALVGICDRVEFDGRWAQGFVPEMIEKSETEVLLAELDPRLYPPEKVMFVNRRFHDGRPMPALMVLREPLSWLLGRLKVAALLIARGLPADALTPAGKDYYAFAYRIAMETALDRRLERAAKEAFGLDFPFQSTGPAASNSILIERLRQQMQALPITPRDKEILPQLL